MARSYNPRSDSSDSLRRSSKNNSENTDPRVRRDRGRASLPASNGATSNSRYSRAPRSSGSSRYSAYSTQSGQSSFSNRKKVEYNQSAKSDLAQPPKQDDRARYARYKKNEQGVRVLPAAGESRFADKTRTSSGFSGEDFNDSALETQRRWAREQRGITVREHRMQQSKATKPRSRVLGRIVIILLVLVVLVGAAVITYFSPAFSIATIDIKGNEQVSTEHLSALVGDISDTTLLRVNTDRIQSGVLNDPWVESVQVERSFPSTLTVTVTERKAAATVEVVSTAQATVTTSYWLISAGGMWLGSVDPTASGSLLQNVNITAEQVQQMPRIRDVSASITTAVGATTQDEGVTNALAIIKNLSAEMIAQIRFISSPDRVKTSLTLNNNVEVAFGAAEDVAAKEKVITTFLQEHQGNIVFINVRVVDRPTYRAK